MTTAFNFKVWVHHKNGGNDECYAVTINTDTEVQARKKVVTWLKRKKSAVLDDFQLIKK